MNDLLAIAIYVVALFFLGLGNAIIYYHILRYRDPEDISGFVLAVYTVLVLGIVIGTALLINWNTVFAAPVNFS